MELEVGFGAAVLRHPLAASTAGLLPALWKIRWKLVATAGGRVLRWPRFIGFGFTQDAGLALSSEEMRESPSHSCNFIPLSHRWSPASPAGSSYQCLAIKEVPLSWFIEGELGVM